MIFFYFLLTLILLLDSLSLSGVKNIEFFFILQAPILLFLIDYLQKKSFKIPKSLFMLQIIFLTLFVIANIFSSNYSNIIYEIGFYTALILIYIYVYNHQNELKQTIYKYICGISILFIAVNIFKTQIMQLFPFIGVNNSHIISYTSFTHNHLGDFLVLPLIILAIGMIKEVTWIRLLSFIVIFPTFIFSYSRSAYLSLIVVLVLISYKIFKKINNSKKIIITICLLISVLFLFFSPTLTKGEKKPFGYRDVYYKKAVEGFIKKPFFGWGAGNYANISAGTIYSHNIFLDMLSENGIFVFLMFLSMILYGLFYGEKNLYYYLFIALLINFQTDLTYSIIPFIWLFFIFMGLTIK